MVHRHVVEVIHALAMNQSEASGLETYHKPIQEACEANVGTAAVPGLMAPARDSGSTALTRDLVDPTGSVGVQDWLVSKNIVWNEC